MTHEAQTYMWKVFASSNKVRLLEGAKTCKLDFCEHYIIWKKTKVKFSTATHCIENILDYVHINIWRPTKMASIRGHHYFMSLIDDYFRRWWVYTIKHKGKVLELFVEWKRIWRRIQEGRTKYSIHTTMEGTSVILSYNCATLRA